MLLEKFMIGSPPHHQGSGNFLLGLDGSGGKRGTRCPRMIEISLPLVLS
jgi:hypothetical protein